MSTRPFTVDALRFRTLWAVQSSSLMFSGQARQRHVLPPAGKTFAAHLSLVARLPQVVDPRIDKILLKLKKTHSCHYYYPAGTVHLTIKNLDALAGNDDDCSALISQIRSRIESSGPLEFRARGLGLSPSSVFLQLFPLDDSLTVLRRRLASLDPVSDRKRRGFYDALLRSLFRRLAYANLIRFSGELSPSLVQEISQHRNSCFGQFSIMETELVRTDKLFSEAGTTLIGRVVLAGGEMPSRTRVGKPACD